MPVQLYLHRMLMLILTAGHWSHTRSASTRRQWAWTRRSSGIILREIMCKQKLSYDIVTDLLPL